jgi:hypothetical protein
MRYHALLLLLAFASAAPAAEVTTLSGRKLTGDVVAVTAEGVTLKTAAGEESIPAADLLVVELSNETPRRDKYAEIELTDGSVLACESFAFKGDRAEMKLVSGPTVAAPLAAVSTVLQNAHDATVRQEWQDVLRKRTNLDMVVIPSGAKLDAVKGTLDAIEFAPEGTDQKISPKLARAAGLVFVRRPDAGAPPAFCKVVDTAGNTLVARSVRLDGEALAVDLVSGGSVRYPSLKPVLRLDFSRGKLTYLSDLEPIEREETSTEDLVFPYRRDRNLYGGPLRLKGVLYSKGLSVHSRSSLAFDIGGDYKEFRAVLGVDDVVRTEGGAPVRVSVLVEGDGRELFKGEVQSRDEPKPLALDVKGVRRLRILVAAPLLDLGNQVNLCDARVSK